MSMIKKIFGICIILVVSFLSNAQTSTPNFSLPNVADDGIVSLETYSTYAGIAVVFTSNVCPYDLYYSARIRDMVTRYQGKIQFILINSHLDAAETTDQMKVAYGSWNLSIPYLSDKSQIAMGHLGVRKSPEVFLLKKVGEEYKVLYSGAIDDNPQMPTAVTDSYAMKAIDALLAGQQSSPSNVRAAGCTIRKK